MSFTLKKSAFDSGVNEIKIIPYYNYGICIRIYEDVRYELWNFRNIPLSNVTKAVADFLSDNRTIDTLQVEDKNFRVPNVSKDEIRKALFNFLMSLEESKLEEN